MVWIESKQRTWRKNCFSTNCTGSISNLSGVLVSPWLVFKCFSTILKKIQIELLGQKKSTKRQDCGFDVEKGHSR
jgi:hypothetical protein